VFQLGSPGPLQPEGWTYRYGGGGSDIIRGVPILLDADMTVHDIVAALERLQFRNGFRLGGYVMPITKIRGLGTKHRHGVFLAEGE
jgi:hypothetical protein